MHVLLIILGFIWWWPLGLLALGFLIARRRYVRGAMYCAEASAGDGFPRMDRWERKLARAQDKVDRARSRMERFMGGGGFGGSSSGNRAFDDYRAQTLKWLEEEQHEFKDFLERLRFAKDRAEFDQFIAERRVNPASPETHGEPPPAEPKP